ncbi:MAG: selenide, water dikinase SelD [Chroococcales cyanobacterium]
MQHNINPIVKDLVFIGGGHSHAIALKMLGMNPIPGVRLTLISETPHTPYSGMLPGHVAGFYSFDECHIDLRRLCGFAKAQFYVDQAISLDLANNKVICANHPPVAFDYLSIDIGSTPNTVSVPGADKYAIPVKPVSSFLQVWYRWLEKVKANPPQSLKIAIVGGGAGGVELALNVQSRLQRELKSHRDLITPLEIHLFHRDEALLSYHNAWVSQRLDQIVRSRGIQVHLQETVSEVLPHQVICESGLTVECDTVFWVTQASAPSWLQASGLKTDAKGFIAINDKLQSVSHPSIFAAGDVATMIEHPRPKAGVFAVRQGKPLVENLRRIIEGKALKPYIPQKRYLSLIGTGNQEAIASWWKFGLQSPLLWHWKDRIDRQFMQRFDQLPSMDERRSQTLITTSDSKNDPPKSPLKRGTLIQYPPFILPSPSGRGARGEGLGADHSANLMLESQSMRCAGCGSKVGSTLLERVLKRIEVTENSNILIGLNAPDDAAVVQVPENRLIVHTIDFFRSLTNDPYIFAQIATQHCLSDIFAMGATPQTALAVVTIPYATENILEETLYQLLSGATKILQETQTSLVGGHTTEGAELAFGLSCNGLVHPNRILRKNGMQPNQVLILTKPLGTGTLFAADMRYQAKGRWIQSAIESMLLSNQTAAKLFLEHQATACTDITGFGLLGHLIEMVNASQVAIELQLDAIPALPGAMETLKQGFTSSLQPENLRAAYRIENLAEVSYLPKYPLLFDPQTSGGLLGAIPKENAEACLKALKAAGYSESCIVGNVTETVTGKQPISIVVD